MKEPGGCQANAEIRPLVADASCALARLDQARLEELALSCQALNRSLGSMSAEEKSNIARQAKDAEADMAVFARVLEATRANLSVMNRVRELRMGRIEYSEQQALGGSAVASPSTDFSPCGGAAEAGHGDD